MEPEFWISELGRLFEKTTEAINENQISAAEVLAEQFNEALKELKEEYPENDIVQRVEPVEAINYSPAIVNLGKQSDSSDNSDELVGVEALHEIRNQCARIVNALGYDLPTMESVEESPENIVMVTMENRQSVDQDITFESLLAEISGTSLSPEIQQELQELVHEFQEELATDSPDESKLNRIISQVKEQAPMIAAQLVLLAVEHGAANILG